MILLPEFRLQNEPREEGTGKTAELSMNPIDFVIASTPRSGTKYIAHVLREAGVPTGHEAAFNPYIAVTYQKFHYWGDVSWESVPFLHLLPKHTRILHQLRHPVDSINSRLPAWTIPDHPYTQFIYDTTKHIRWPSPAQPGLTIEEAIPNAILFWWAWHQHIEKIQPALTYCIEDLNVDLLCEILKTIKAPCRTDNLQECMDKISKDVNPNPWGKSHPILSWDDLPPQVQDYAAEKGYEARTSTEVSESLKLPNVEGMSD